MIVVIAYPLLGIVVMSLNFFDVISNMVTLALFISMTILSIFIIFLRMKGLRRKTGEMIIELNKDLVTELICIAISFAMYSIIPFWDLLRKNPNKLGYITLACMYYFPLYVFYLSIFSKNIIGEKGIFYEDKLVTWDKIESYHWVERRFQLRKGFTGLFIKSKTRILINLKIDQTQKNEIDIFLLKKIGSKEIANDR